MRLVVLGGSGSSTPELFDALADWPGGPDRRPPLAVVLVGRSADRLRIVAQACRARPLGPGAACSVETSTNRRTALEGADVVLNQVRIGGYGARAIDETFPWTFDLPGEETMGPGGFANALRTIPALREAWSDVADVAPSALLVNLTNPAGIVQQAVARESGLTVVSVCDSPIVLLDAVAARLGRPLGEVRARYVGMNHVGWYVPASADELKSIADMATGMGPEIVALHGALPAPYVRYYVHPDRIVADQRGKETRAQALLRLEATLLEGYAASPSAAMPRRGAIVWYRIAVLALVDAWLHGSDVAVLAGVRNGDRIPTLPPDAVLELAHRAPRPRCLVPLDPPSLPPLPGALLAAHATYEMLAVDALLPGADEEARLRALMANPMVRSYDQAAGLLKIINEQEHRALRRDARQPTSLIRGHSAQR
jgi:6-phospho-beta-glucosidase